MEQVRNILNNILGFNRRALIIIDGKVVADHDVIHFSKLMGPRSAFHKHIDFISRKTQYDLVPYMIEESYMQSYKNDLVMRKDKVSKSYSRNYPDIEIGTPVQNLYDSWKTGDVELCPLSDPLLIPRYDFENFLNFIGDNTNPAVIFDIVSRNHRMPYSFVMRFTKSKVEMGIYFNNIYLNLMNDIDENIFATAWDNPYSQKLVTKWLLPFVYKDVAECISSFTVEHNDKMTAVAPPVIRRPHVCWGVR